MAGLASNKISKCIGMSYDLESLIGQATAEQMRWVEIFPSARLVLAVPVLGQCEYATSPAHTHPGYMVLVSAETVPMAGFNTDPGPVGFQLRVLPPMVPHQEMRSAMPHRYYAVMVSPAWFEALAQEHGVAARKLLWEPYAASERLLRLLREFMQECDAQANDDVRDALALLIVVEILRCIRGRVATDIVSPRGALRHVVEELEHRFAEPWCLNDLARLACMSPSSLLRVFKADLGCSPMQCLLRIRIRRAQQLLRLGQSVAQCAQATGFASASHLSEAFRKQTGMSPLAYRKRYMAP
jgi:AraC family transcriptional regulator